MIGQVITTAGMIRAFREVSTTGSNRTTEDFANEITGALLPAGIGSPLILIGLALVLLGWWRSRREKASS